MKTNRFDIFKKAEVKSTGIVGAGILTAGLDTLTKTMLLSALRFQVAAIPELES